jgi:phosphoglycolate phosphatase-like HAD superfamily hydrolase
MRFRYLLWDFDGTLFDTYPPLVQAIERALADLGSSEPRAEIERLLGITLSDCVSTLAGRHGLDMALFEALIDGHYRRTMPQDMPPFPGAIRVCERLIAAGGGNYMFTHRTRQSLYRLLDAYGVAELFADCLTVEDGYPRKPDPAGLIALLEKHSLPRDEVLAVGDRDLDIVAGQGAGVRTCLFNAPPSAGVEPDYVITEFQALARIIGLREDE